MAWAREGLRGSSKHSNFIPTITTQRENRANLVNVNTMATSVKIRTLHFAHHSPHPRSCNSSFQPPYPSFIQIQSHSFLFSTIPMLLSALDNLSTNKGQPPTSPVPSLPTHRILYTWTHLFFYILLWNFVRPQYPPSLKFLHSLGVAPGFPCCSELFL